MMPRTCFVIMLVIWSAMGVSAAELPGPAAWRAQGGAGPASLQDDGAMLLPFDFTGSATRAYWDVPVSLNLTEARGIAFSVQCADASSISYGNVYFRAGAGWYMQEFSVPSGDGWHTVTIDKLGMGAEEAPAGFSAVDSLRFSLWKGAAGAAALQLRDFRVVPATGTIVLVRADSSMAHDRSRARTMSDMTLKVSAVLDGLGAGYVPLADRDLTAARLEGKSLVVFPYNPEVPANAWPALEAFSARGGKVLTFFNPPERLAQLAGVALGAFAQETRPGQFARIVAAEGAPEGLPAVTTQASWNIRDARPTGEGRVAAWWHDDAGATTGKAAVVITPRGAHMTHVFLNQDPRNSAPFLLSLVAHGVPGIWAEAATKRLVSAGAFAGFENTAHALETLAASTDPRVTAHVAEARAARDRAQERIAAGEHGAALDAAGAVGEALLRAYAAGQPSKPNEWRGFWCHNAYGVSGLTWDEAVKRLAENGFTAILPNMLWGGVAYYPSEVLPVAPEVARQGDALAACLAACKKYGVECHVWKVNWNMAGRAPAAFKAEMKRTGRTQVDKTGAADEEWLCPSNPANQQLEISAMVEVATKYDVDGVHFDYIRYPGADHCFCAGCKQRFEAQTGMAVAPWPDAVLSGGSLAEPWREFRRGHISRVVDEVARQLDETKPHVKVSAAVFRDWPADRDSIGQDWGAWCQAGWLDFVCPMDYTASTPDFARMVARQREWVGGVPLYPGIGYSTWQLEAPMVTLFAQIRAAREAGAPGFTVFNYGTREAEEVLPLCGLGITRVD
jgi:uncharacterized lipoprotein YddW (UPF0748 family)